MRAKERLQFCRGLNRWPIGLMSCVIALCPQIGSAQESYVLSDGRAVATLEMFQECDACPEMIVLPLGDFMMGGPIGDSRYPFVAVNGQIISVAPDDPRTGADERPVHRVEADYAFAMGRNEVTHNEWMACVTAGGCGGHVPKDEIVVNPARFDGNGRADVGGNHPVIDVSYLDMLGYVDWLNSVVGADVYRIPTEAEWEYAARAGTQTRFGQGDEITTDQANFNGEATEDLRGVGPVRLVMRGKPIPVDMLDAANNWGLRHMSSNVIERTASCYTEQYLGWSTLSEWREKSVSVAEGCRRVTRGGSYGGAAEFGRVASRGSGREDFRSPDAGFRVVRILE